MDIYNTTIYVYIYSNKARYRYAQLRNLRGVVAIDLPQNEYQEDSDMTARCAL